MDINVLINNLRKENLPIGEYAVFGSAILAVRGLREAPNIDVIVTDRLWEELRNSQEPDDEGFIRRNGIKFSNWWFVPTRKTIPTMIQEAEAIDGIPFVKIEEVLDYKNYVNRDKDKKDVDLITNFLNSQKQGKSL